MLLPCQCKNPQDSICYRLIIIESVRYCRKYKDFPLKQHDWIALLRRNGWEFVRQESSHQHWEKNGIRREFAWPSRRYATPIFIKTLLKKFGITLEDKKKMDTRLSGRANKQSELLPEDTFGGRLARARIGKNMSQMVLANLLRAPQPHISKWERGTTKPSDLHMQKLAEIFGWEDMLRVIKPVTASIEIIQTDRLPGTIESVIVDRQPEATATVRSLPPEPEPEERPERPPEKEILDPILMPSIPPEQLLVMREPESEIVDEAPDEIGIALLALAKNIGIVSDYLADLRRENLILKEQLQDTGEKAKKWDLVKELMADEA